MSDDRKRVSPNPNPIAMEATRGSSGRRKQRWMGIYSSDHDILLVGEGDFSFSLCLAMAFASATNIVATSLDTYDELLQKYLYAYENLMYLQALGATLLHGVDATKGSILRDLGWRKFHRIIFNFPHAGFVGKEDDPRLIKMHQNLVRGFLKNASSMLWPDGEIHINHKITAPFDTWKIEQLAPECALCFIGADKFKIRHYPGYQNKRGAGFEPDKRFPLGQSRTFKFKLNPSVGKTLKTQNKLDSTTPNSPSLSLTTLGNVCNHPNLQVDRRNDCHKTVDEYLNHMEETVGSTSYGVHQSACAAALNLGSKMYVEATLGRCLSCYVGISDEVNNLSMLKLEQVNHAGNH